MSDYKNTNSEGENRHCEANFADSVVTVCTEFRAIFSFNCRDLTAYMITPWLRAGRSTRRERGGAQNSARKWRLMWGEWS
jgi:hypothetical protein